MANKPVKLSKPSLLSKVGHIFKTLAPTIGQVAMSAIPGVSMFEPIATAILASHLKTASTPEAVVSALAAPTEDTLKAVSDSEPEFVAALGKLNVDLEALEVQDTANARSLAATLKSSFPYWAGALLIVACLGIEFWILIHGLPAGLDPVITGRILGTTDTLAALAAGYIWGSSGGSQGKDEVLGEALKNATK